MSAPLLVVGDSLLDRDVDGRVERLCPEGPVPVLDEEAARERPGGAALAATLAALDGRPVTLATALGRDEAGARLAALLERAGVEVVHLGPVRSTPEKIRFRCDGRILLRLDRGGAEPGPVADAPALAEALAGAASVLVSDYGRGVAAGAAVRELLGEAARALPLVWDPHPRGVPPVAGAALATPNAAETLRLTAAGEDAGRSREALVGRARELLARWEAGALAVTLGAEGALLVTPGAPPLLSPARAAEGGDPCGAGDRFAAAVAGLLGDGALLQDAVHAGVAAATGFVAAGGAGSVDLARPRREPEPAAGRSSVHELVLRTRAVGGKVVMTGGCFDLLHAGHVRMLQAARKLGECLVVCLNSDESVRRLKGGGRPVVGQDDRAELLLALGCVDAVAVFDEDTPAETLERFRPDVFVKGGDYALGDLPEAALVESWGGEAVILPYEEGRSTTRLLEEVLTRAG